MLKNNHVKQRAIQAWVSGSVQGVNYRRATQLMAQKLNISGWAKNLPDGRVEVLACGSTAALDDLIAWLHHGPMLAKVTHVIVQEIECQEVNNDEFLVK